MSTMGWMGAAAAVATGVCLSGCAGWDNARFKETRELTLAAQPGAGLDVATRNGSIEVEAHDAPTVLVRARLKATTQERLDAMRVLASYETPGVLRVGVEWPEGQRMGSEGCSFEIVGPAFDGVRLNSSNGALVATGQLGPGLYRTSNGAVRVTDQLGSVDVVTSNGRVVLDGVEHAVSIVTSNGGARVTLLDGATGPIDVSTSNGSVTLSLPVSMSGRLSATTSNGSISVDGVPETAQVESISRRSLRMAMSAPGEASTIATSNGSVRIGFGSSD